MSDHALSQLRFIECLIDEVSFKRNTKFQYEDKEINLNFKFDSEVSIAETRDKAVILLTCKIFEDEDIMQLNLPFSLKLTMRGQFECTSDVDIETFQLNAMAIVLPYLRAQITNLTAQAGIPPVILPPINVVNFFSEQNEE